MLELLNIMKSVEPPEVQYIWSKLLSDIDSGFEILKGISNITIYCQEKEATYYIRVDNK